MDQSTDRRARDRVVASWLLVCCTLVFLMVVLGGVTRLTGSGLSMVDWRPLLGWLPPLSSSEWQRVFELYQQSPEFRLINSHMVLEDFKNIFWLEYLHRLLGRTIGLVFVIPCFFFLLRGDIPRHQWPRYLLMFALGGLQGVLGWYMVKSGLIDNPHVSHYRLTSHLLAAFAIYAYMLWVALSLLYPKQPGPRHPWFRKTAWLTGLVSLTITSGGLVAGLKAGKLYNTFPKMNEHWLPPGLTALDPWWRNVLDNVATVQFDHRILAVSTLVSILAYRTMAARSGLPARARPAANALLHTGLLQVALGISTLLMAVPVVLGAMHQAVAMLLFTVSLYLLHSLR